MGTEPVGIKNDELKPRFELIDYDALLLMVAALTTGAVAYSPDNWRYVDPSRYVGAAGRHLADRARGEVWDDDTDLPHSALLMANAMFLVAADLGDSSQCVEDVLEDWKRGLIRLVEVQKNGESKAKGKNAKKA